jgi:hypothetical protein
MDVKRTSLTRDCRRTMDDPPTAAESPAATPAQASRASAEKPERPDTLLSYERRDSAFVRQLVRGLSERGQDVWVDLEDIPKSADWRAKVGPRSPLHFDPMRSQEAATTRSGSASP